MNYLLKSLPANRQAYDGFEWPSVAGVEVVAPDWDPTPEPGGGLHGALNGQGDGSLFYWNEESVWIVAEIDGDYVDLDGKIKVERCRTVVVGTQEDATSFLSDLGFTGIIGATLTGGHRSTLTFRSWDIKADRLRLTTVYVGEDGIEAGVPYRLVNGVVMMADV